jgi:hypothetical protein
VELLNDHYRRLFQPLYSKPEEFFEGIFQVKIEKLMEVKYPDYNTWNATNRKFM